MSTRRLLILLGVSRLNREGGSWGFAGVKRKMGVMRGGGTLWVHSSLCSEASCSSLRWASCRRMLHTSAKKTEVGSWSYAMSKTSLKRRGWKGVVLKVVVFKMVLIMGKVGITWNS